MANGLFMVGIICVQILGALIALALCYIIRILLYTDSFKNEQIMIPDQNPYFPMILEHTNGLPAYGQIFISEMFGTCVFALVYLIMKYELDKGKVDPVSAALACAATLYGMIETFRNVSNGVHNPALHIAQIVWQTTTYKYGSSDWSHWTPDSVTMYIAGPCIGACLAAVLFNVMKHWFRQIEDD